MTLKILPNVDISDLKLLNTTNWNKYKYVLIKKMIVLGCITHIIKHKTLTDRNNNKVFLPYNHNNVLLVHWNMLLSHFSHIKGSPLCMIQTIVSSTYIDKQYGHIFSIIFQ